jgi:hypothetical protein
MRPYDVAGAVPEPRPAQAKGGFHRLGGYALPRLSVLVLGCGLLILVSLLVPFFEPPFGGAWYLQWLSGGTAILGTVALMRREPGRVARAALVVTLMSAALFVFTIVFPWAYSLAMGVLIPD